MSESVYMQRFAAGNALTRTTTQRFVIMKTLFLSATAVLLSCGLQAQAQSPAIEPTPTPVKLVITNTMPPIKPAAPRPTPTPIIVGQSEAPHGPSAAASPAPIVVGASSAATVNAGVRAALPSMSFGTIKSKIAEAKREMQSRPIATASAESTTVAPDFVRVAFLDSKTHRIDYAVMTKDAFLSTTQDKTTVSQNGKSLIIRTIRGNGVNTPLSITDSYGVAHTPLIVQYPVVRGGQYVETAYYVSTHNGVVTPEVVNAGRLYVRNVIEIARDRLKEKGIAIQPKVADIAERLATVEHVDHMRFKNEYHPNIYNDIFTLYALNEGQTYRYSVSSAGAGGMVQMIPATYRMMRSRYPGVGLMPDFVEGMRNHVNATQAMLLYMQMTWNDLAASPTVSYAMASKFATQEQLMAAGYNSNPAKLPGYINRGGENWTNLIPNETKMYLQIYSSLERFVPMAERAR